MKHRVNDKSNILKSTEP